MKNQLKLLYIASTYILTTFNYVICTDKNQDYQEIAAPHLKSTLRPLKKEKTFIKIRKKIEKIEQLPQLQSWQHLPQKLQQLHKNQTSKKIEQNSSSIDSTIIDTSINTPINITSQTIEHKQTLEKIRKKEYKIPHFRADSVDAKQQKQSYKLVNLYDKTQLSTQKINE